MWGDFTFGVSLHRRAITTWFTPHYICAKEGKKQHLTYNLKSLYFAQLTYSTVSVSPKQQQTTQGGLRLSQYMSGMCQCFKLDQRQRGKHHLNISLAATTDIRDSDEGGLQTI